MHACVHPAQTNKRPPSISPPRPLQVQFELLFGATFLRALSQLKEEGEEDDLRRSEAEAAAAGEERAAGQQQREQPAMPARFEATAVQGVRVFRDRELLVCVCVCRCGCLMCLF